MKANIKMSDAKRLEEARVFFVMRYPFFAGLLCRRSVILTDEVDTAAVDDKGRIYVSPTFMKKLTTEQLQFLLAHECMHAVFAHRLRIHGRNHLLWNIAGDAVINYMLKKVGVGEPIDGMVDFDWVKDDTSAEEVYDKLLKDGESHKDMPGGVEDLTSDTPKQECDGNSNSKPTESEINAAVQQGKLEVAAAYQGEKLRGAGGGALGSIIEAMLKVKVPWHELLERYMTAKQRDMHTWGRPNKRYLRTAYLPGKTHMPSMGRVVIGIDTSGSISDNEIAGFLGQVGRICETCDPEAVDILYTTDTVEEHEHYEHGDYMFEAKHNRWHGGTDMCAVTRWVDEQDEDTDVCVIFTDGYTPFPTEASCDVIWVFTSDMKLDDAAVGEVIYLEN